MAGTITTNTLTIDRHTMKAYGPFSTDDIILLAGYTSCTENQDAIDSSTISLSYWYHPYRLCSFRPRQQVSRSYLRHTLELASARGKHQRKKLRE